MVDVLIVHAALPEDDRAAGAAALLTRLPYARRLELEGRTPAGRLAGLAGSALALAGAGRLRGHAVGVADLRFPAGGKPSLAGGPWFSVSHSARRVAVALSDRCELGLDLEDAAARVAPVDARGLGRWTATEAALKAVGAGLRAAGRVRLARDLGTAVVGGIEVHLRSLALAADCVACLGTRARVESLAVEQVEIEW
jgi:hypothetical protein